MAAPRKKEAPTAVALTRLKEQSVRLKIVGETPYIPHRWSEKAKRMMPGHPERDTMSKLGEREPETEAEACVYRLPDGKPGIPATGIKAAMVGACRFFEKPSMVEAKIMFGVSGTGPDQLIEFEGEPILREDTPRNASGTADLRYRYAFWPWSAVVTVTFVSSSISAQSIVALLDAAGRLGIGDWRPSSPKSATGTFGQFRVAPDQDLPL